MSEYRIQSETLEAIGDAIREKTGGSALINPEDMATEIANISSGGGGGSGYEWKTYTGTMSFSDELVTEPVIPVDSSNALVLFVAFQIKRTGTVANGVVTYDDVPTNHGSNMCLGYGINVSTLALNGEFIYRYGTSASTSGETMNAFPQHVRYRSGNSGQRLGDFQISPNIDALISSSGILLPLGNATRAFCRTGLYMEFEYTVKMLEEVTS